MINSMANDPLATTLPYETVAGDDASWRLLRIGAVLWASLVLVRHATYWGGVIAERAATPAGFGAPGERFPFAEIEVAAEAVILFSTLVVALGLPRATPPAVRALRTLGGAFVLLVLFDFAFNSQTTWAGIRNDLPTGRAIVKFVWQFVSKAQLLVVPLLLAIGPGRRRPAR